MKKLSLIPCAVLGGLFTCAAQSGPSIQWQKCFGGSGTDMAYRICQAPGGGFIVAGSSTSNDGDVTGHHGAAGVADAWVVAVDPAGNLLWQKSYGGSGADAFYKIIATSDGGFIAVGGTSSNDGDVSGNHGGGDVWVVKLNATGTLQWQVCLGGSGTDVGNGIVQTSDGGYAVIGTTASTDGQVSGLHGNNDSWVAKLDASGNLQWQHCYGGSYDDRGNDITAMANGEFLLSVVCTSEPFTDGDYIGVGGNSNGSQGYLFKIDASGKILGGFWCSPWSSAVGNIRVNDQQYYCLENNTYCVPSNYTSGIAIVALDSSFGNHGTTSFQSCYPMGSVGFGAYYSSTGGAMTVLSNGTGVLAASTNDTVKLGNHGGPADGFLANFGPNNWGKCFGGSGTDYFKSIVSTDDLTYYVAGYTNSNDGNVSGNHGDYDFWVVRFSNITNNTIKGTVFLDYNLNGTKDAGEPFADNLQVQSQKGSSVTSSLTINGGFSNTVDTGTYTTSVLTTVANYTAVPAAHTSTFSSYGNTDSTGFALQPIPGRRDYLLNLIPPHQAFLGDSCVYEVQYVNAGTDTLRNRVVQLIKDHRTSYLTSSLSPLSVSGDTIRWNIASLSPRDTGSITVVLKLGVPPVLNNADMFLTTAIIDTTADLNPQNNIASFAMPAYTNPGIQLPWPPQISGLAVAYCSNSGAQQIEVSNMPGFGTTVSATIDGQATTVSGSGGITLQPASLAAGTHVLAVVFADLAGANTTKDTFLIVAAAIPVVKLASNLTAISDTTSRIVLTATVLAGGGTRPLYTFARDRQFASMIQAEGQLNTVTMSGGSLAVGENSFYVRLRTSDTCYTVQTAMDSVVIVRNQSTNTAGSGGGDSTVTIGPNPFVGKLSVSGLQTAETYSIRLVNSNGQVVLQQRIKGQMQADLLTGSVRQGIYLLQLYDETKGRVIFTREVLSSGAP